MRALLITFLLIGCTRPNPSNVMTFGKINGAGAPTGVDCAAQSDCGSCCISAHPAGHDSWVNNVRSCECAVTGNCKQECAATFCAAQAPDSLCDVCLQNDLSSGICNLTGACANETECTAFVACLGGCPG
jgi:hypothetical protein